MNHPTAWTPLADVANKLQSYWERRQISAARLGGTPHCFFLELSLRKPDVRRISECFNEVRKWIKALARPTIRNWGIMDPRDFPGSPSCPPFILVTCAA